jgi:hypothetical protein
VLRVVLLAHHICAHEVLSNAKRHEHTVCIPGEKVGVDPCAQRCAGEHPTPRRHGVVQAADDDLLDRRPAIWRVPL